MSSVTSTSGNKKFLLSKTKQVGLNTLLSRFLGLAREIVLIPFLGVGVVADGFNTAFLIPNSLRKMFAEGALTAAFVPTFVNLFHKEGKKQTDALMAFAFLFFEGLVLLLCALVMLYPAQTTLLIMSGFSQAQVDVTVRCLRILMPFIFFISTSALLAGALNSVNHFFVPAFCPALLNMFFIGGTLVCIHFSLSVEYLCYAIMLGGFVQFVLHVYTYIREGFSVALPTRQAWPHFKHILIKFVPCFFSMSVMELNLIVDQHFASYLHPGSVTLIKYSSRFMGIPLGVFAIAFSTILLPHFSRVRMYAPKRLSFYLLESVKFIFWVMLPATLIMGYLSEDIFQTLFASVSKKFPAAMVPEAGYMLLGYLIALFPLSVNKILLNLFYSAHDTRYPMIVAIVATVCNFFLNYLLVGYFGGFGIALATSISSIIQMLIFLLLLHRIHGFELYMRPLFSFVVRYSVQVVAVLVPFYFLYRGMLHLLNVHLTISWIHFFFLKSFGFWLWVGPGMIAVFYILKSSNIYFKTKLYFLD